MPLPSSFATVKILYAISVSCQSEVRQNQCGAAARSLEKTPSHFGSKKELNVGLKYEAAGTNQVQVIDVFSTDGQLIKYNMVVLQDDKHFFPPYYAAPIVRQDTLKAYPEVSTILNKLAGKFTDQAMQQLN